MTTDKIPAEIMLNEVGLKPCPFCGGDAKLVDATKILGKFRIIHRCEAVGAISVERFDGGDAIEAWNRRATVQGEQKPVAYLSKRVVRAFDEAGTEIVDAMLFPRGSLRPEEEIPLYTHPVDRDSVETAWRPIGTAPKDGTRFYAAMPDGEGWITGVCLWCKTPHVPLYGFHFTEGDPEDWDMATPTHWQPIPTPPARAKGGE